MGDAAACDKMFAPVVDGKRFDANAGSWLGAMDKLVLPEVDARMVARPRDLEYDDIPGTQVRTFDLDADLGLILAHARYPHTVSGAGPVDQPGTVKARGRGVAAVSVGAAKLALCGSSNARPAGVRRIGVVHRTDFSAGRKQYQRGAEYEQSAEPEGEQKSRVGVHGRRSLEGEYILYRKCKGKFQVVLYYNVFTVDNTIYIQLIHILSDHFIW